MVLEQPFGRVGGILCRLLGCLPYRDLQSQAQVFARRLIGAGIARGERLLLIADTWPGFCISRFPPT